MAIYTDNEEKGIILDCICFDSFHQLKVIFCENNIDMEIYLEPHYSNTSRLGHWEPNICYWIRRKSIQFVDWLGNIKRAVFRQPTWEFVCTELGPKEMQALARFITSKVGDGNDELGEAGSLD